MCFSLLDQCLLIIQKVMFAVDEQYYEQSNYTVGLNCTRILTSKIIHLANYV